MEGWEEKPHAPSKCSTRYTKMWKHSDYRGKRFKTKEKVKEFMESQRREQVEAAAAAATAVAAPPGSAAAASSSTSWLSSTVTAAAFVAAADAEVEAAAGGDEMEVEKEEEEEDGKEEEEEEAAADGHGTGQARWMEGWKKKRHAPTKFSATGKWKFKNPD